MSDVRDCWTRFANGGMKAQRAVDTILEKHWQEQVEHIASLFGWRKYHTLDSRGSDEDFPDLVLLRGGR
jgi:hypothetical protein